MGKKTRDFPRSSGIMLYWDILNSRAYEELTRSEITVFNVFYLKRKFAQEPKKKSTKRTRRDRPVVNNGEIVFTYGEAEGYGINASTFTRAIDKLVKVGFIDIAEPSPGFKQPTKYATSERWKSYGNPGYVETQRKKALNMVGRKTRFMKLRVPGLDGIMGTVQVQLPPEEQTTPTPMRAGRNRLSRINAGTER